MKTTTQIRTDSRANAVVDLSYARLRGETLPELVELDDGDVLAVVETEPGQWQAELDGLSWPL